MRQEHAARDAERGAVISRHDMLKVGLGGAAGLAGTGLLAAVGTSHKVTAQGPQQEHSSHAPMPMPNVNGEQFCRFIKSNSLFKGIKVLLCSGENVEELQRICREAGADGYIPKDAVLAKVLAGEFS